MTAYASRMEPKRPRNAGLDGVASLWAGPDIRAHRDQRGRAVRRVQDVRTAHRAHKKKCEHIWRGNKRLVNSVRFRCQNRSCGSVDVRLYNAHTEAEATMWLAGDPLPEGREETP